MKKIILIVVIVLTLITAFVVYRLNEMEIHANKTIEITFGSVNDLSGTLYLPKKDGPYKVVIFIHGDGAANRTLDGGYNFIINRLVNAGYACFSYDKAGVSKSSGNWLNQTMEDRAKEVVDATSAIKKEIEVQSIGTLAFSQGGWVTSELALMNAKLDFNIVVGNAIDWMDQHIYYETKYAKSLGLSEDETNKYFNYVNKCDSYIKSNDYNGYLDYVKNNSYESPMTKERFKFVYLNYKSNAEEGIKEIKTPFLGIFGDSDNNVDTRNSTRIYKKIFDENGKTDYELHMIKDANHELLNSKYNENKDNLFIDSFLYGDKIFAKGFLNLLVDWLDKTIKN